MADNTLTLALEGDVALPDFREAVNHFTNLIDLLSREIAPSIEITWLIDDLQSGSAIATVVGISEQEEYVFDVIKGYSRVGNALQRREPIPFSASVAREAISITKLISDKIIAIRFETAESDAVVYGEFDVLQAASAAPRVSFGAVKGRVQALNSRGNLKFTLYDSVFDKPVNCYLQKGREDLMIEIWGKNVVVTGRVTRNVDTGRPVSVREITSIDPVLDFEPGTYKIARGIFPWTESDEPAEVSIRRLRDAEDD